MKIFKNAFDRKGVDDWGSEMSDRARLFIKGFKEMLARELPKRTEFNLKRGHYFVSGFVSLNGHTAYISYEIPRGCVPIDFKSADPFTGVLYRTADSDIDFYNGAVHYTSIENLPQVLLEMFGESEVAA